MASSANKSFFFFFVVVVRSQYDKVGVQVLASSIIPQQDTPYKQKTQCSTIGEHDDFDDRCHRRCRRYHHPGSKVLSTDWLVVVVAAVVEGRRRRQRP